MCLLATWAMPIEADESSFQPARIENAAEIAQLIRYPDIAREAEIIIIRCGTTLSKRGRISPGVYSDPAQAAVFRPYEDEVRKVFEKLRIEPARMNDRRVAVWLNFSVIFDNMDGTKKIKIVPNLQYAAKRYGEDYLDPQRIDNGPFPRTCSSRPPLWTLSKTDVNGNATSVSVILGTTVKSCENALMRLLMKSRYIPAHHAGKAVQGTFIEAWYTG